MTFQEDLDRIARLQGKSIPPGHVILGAPGLPAPPLPDEPADPSGDRRSLWKDEDWLDPEDRPELVDPPPASPLIPRLGGAAQKPETPPVQASVEPDLLIAGMDNGETGSIYRGTAVTLNDEEAAQVRRLVLSAIVRQAREHLQKLPLPARKRAVADDAPKPRRRFRKTQKEQTT